METIGAFSLPPGFGFHPTDVELVSHYLKRKILGMKIDFEVIPEVDIYKCEPWDLPAKCQVPTQDSKWHFFSSPDKKYPNGSRSNRATVAGYWKSTGKDRNIKLHNRIIGTKKTLVFHEGRPPSGKRTDWIMHEYYMDDKECKSMTGKKDIFVLCRVTKRNGLAFDNERTSLRNEEIDTCPKLPTDLSVPVVQEESSSPPENKEDLEAWFLELYDPNFRAVQTINELKSEPKILQEGSRSFALKQEQIDFIPNFSEGFHLFHSGESGDGIYSDLPFLSPDTDSGVFGDFNFGSMEFDSSTQFNAGLILSDLTPHTHKVEECTNTAEGSFIVMDDNKSAFTEPHSNIDPIIQVRQRSTRASDFRTSRIKLQVNKMELKNCQTMNQTVKIVNQDRHLDLDDGPRSTFSIKENHNPGGSTDSEDNPPTSKTSNILMPLEPNLQERSVADPVSVGRSFTTRSDDTSCIRGLVRGLFIFLRRCSSSASLDQFFLGACMAGTVAAILYFLLHDSRHFLSNFSALWL